MLDKIEILERWILEGKVKASDKLPSDDLQTLLNQMKILARKSECPELEPTQTGTNKEHTEVAEWGIKNNAGEVFKFFIDEERRACLNIRIDRELVAGLIMSKKEFEGLIHAVSEMNKNVVK